VRARREPGTEVVHHLGRVALGRFSAAPLDPDFGRGVTTRTLVVFPRTAVAICHRNHEEVVADTATVMLYNRGDEYARRVIDPVGDRCHWWSMPDDWWLQVAAETAGAGGLTRPRPTAGRIFADDHCPSAPAVWLRQRTLANAVAAGRVDALATEEALLAVVRAVMGAPASTTPARHGTRWTPSTATWRRHRRLVADTKELLASRFTDELSLDDVATEVGASPYHLSRVFRAVTGHTIHGHRTDLRLRASLDRLPAQDLATVASDLGFSSHSHFTATFRRAFGVSPSQVRKILTA
jgi:AraC family transcriptional regulator